MTDHSAEDLEALRLSLGQVVASPDVWRARAVSAGGFLGAAAAVSLLGLSQQAARFDRTTVIVACVAAGCYVLAVVVFLVASVLPTPKPDTAAGGSLADQIEAFAHKESRPIKVMVLVGAGLGALAIATTTLGSFLVLLKPAHSVATVSLVDREFWESTQSLCPGLVEPFNARLTDDGSAYIRLQILDDACGSTGAELTLPRSQLVLRKPEME